MKPYKKNVKICGVGINDSLEVVNSRGTISTAYSSWRNMICRVYQKEVQNKHPSYIGCTVAPEWLYFSNFKKWYDANYKEGYEVDKDILVLGNKIYSEEFCIMVPNKINLLLCDSKKSRGEYPIGVSYHKRDMVYTGQCNRGSGKKHLGYFKTVEEAHDAWRVAKKNYVCEVAREALEAGEISTVIYDALISREF